MFILVFIICWFVRVSMNPRECFINGGVGPTPIRNDGVFSNESKLDEKIQSSSD